MTRQSMYVLRNINASLLQWKSSNYYMFCVRVCSLSYPSRNAHALYCHGGIYEVFPHYLINVTVFGETLLNTKCVF